MQTAEQAKDVTKKQATTKKKIVMKEIPTLFHSIAQEPNGTIHLISGKTRSELEGNLSNLTDPKVLTVIRGKVMPFQKKVSLSI